MGFRLRGDDNGERADPARYFVGTSE